MTSVGTEAGGRSPHRRSFSVLNQLGIVSFGARADLAASAAAPPLSSERGMPAYRQVARAAVGLESLGRRQLAFVGPPQPVQFYNFPVLAS
jgi:hypothetical protein